MTGLRFRDLPCLRTRVLLVMDLDSEGTVRVSGRRNREGRRWRREQGLSQEFPRPWSMAMPSWASRGHPVHHVRTQSLSSQAEPNPCCWPALAPGTNETLPCPWRADREAGEGIGLHGEVGKTVTQGGNRVRAVGAQLDPGRLPGGSTWGFVEQL